MDVDILHPGVDPLTKRQVADKANVVTRTGSESGNCGQSSGQSLGNRDILGQSAGSAAGLPPPPPTDPYVRN